SRRRRISQVPEWPPCARALLYDPGGTLHSRSDYQLQRAAFRSEYGVGSHDESVFGAQSHGPRAPCVRFANCVTALHATLGSGCRTALPGEVVSLGHDEEFLPGGGRPCSSLLKLAWRTFGPDRIRCSARWQSGPRPKGDHRCALGRMAQKRDYVNLGIWPGAGWRSRAPAGGVRRAARARWGPPLSRRPDGLEESAARRTPPADVVVGLLES